MEKSVNHNEALAKVVEFDQNIYDIQDIDILLEHILSEIRKIVKADAGSIYVVEDKNLVIKYAQNDTQLRELQPGEKLPYKSFSFPINEKSIAGYVAYIGKPLVIDDAYNIPEELPYKFNKQTDLTTNYRTKSIYTIPLKMPDGKIVGVLQIINALDENGKIRSFSIQDGIYINHFATNCEQALKQTKMTERNFKKMLKLSEFRDPKETYRHVERVSLFAVEIYDRWAFDHNIPNNVQEHFRDNLKIASKFHDIGKVGISDLILKKPARFTDEERSIMKGHTALGAMLFHPSESDLDQMTEDIALYHHEYWDGSEKGYPGKINLDTLETFNEETNEKSRYEIGEPLKVSQHLKGEEIPLAARIVAVADVFDALSHRRCYKEAWNIEECFQEIQRSSGTQFDPEVVLSFLKIKDRICAILLANQDD